MRCRENSVVSFEKRHRRNSLRTNNYSFSIIHIRVILLFSIIVIYFLQSLYTGLLQVVRHAMIRFTH